MTRIDPTLLNPAVTSRVTYKVKSAFVDASILGNTAVVAAVVGKKIRVIGYEIVANGAVAIQFRSANTQITSTKYADAAGWGVARQNDQYGYFETAVGEALNINLSAAVAVGVQVTYIEV